MAGSMKYSYYFNTVILGEIKIKCLLNPLTARFQKMAKLAFWALVSWAMNDKEQEYLSNKDNE